MRRPAGGAAGGRPGAMDGGGGGPRAGSDVRLCGYLRKQKSLHRRYFVLRGGGGGGGGGPARLEYYRNEKAFRQGGPAARPRRALPLAGVLSVSKRAPDAARRPPRRHHLLVLYGRDGTFAVAAESAEEQERWFAALTELHRRPQGEASSDGDGDPGSAASGPAFKEVWQVSLRPRGLGHTKNLAGSYLLCLTGKALRFVKLNSGVDVVVLQLLSVRRCGHSENYFFMEVGRSAVTGPGELWMQVEDRGVAQNMHETILEAMKALSDAFRVPSKSRPLASAPIAVPPCPQHLGHASASHAALPWRSRPDEVSALRRSPGAQRPRGSGLQKPNSLSDYSAVSSDEGGSSLGDLRSPNTPDARPDGGLDYISMGRLALVEWELGPEPTKRASLPLPVLEKDTPAPPRGKVVLKPVAVSASYPEGLDRSADPSYVAMLPGVALGAEGRAYVPVTPAGGSPSQESVEYMLMSPSGSCSPEWLGSGGRGSSASDYMNMSPQSCSASSTPPEHSPLPGSPGGPPFISLPGSFPRGSRPRPAPLDPGCLSSSSSTSSEGLEEPARPLRSACPPPGLIVGLPKGSRGGPGAPRSPSVHGVRESGSRAPGRLPSELWANGAEACKGAVPSHELPTAPRARLGQVGARGTQGPPRSEVFPDVEGRVALPWEAPLEPGLNYIDLDLVKEEAGLEGAPGPNPAAVPTQAGAPHTYASIDFHCLGELRSCKPGWEETGP